MARPLRLHPDRLLPVDPDRRAIARRLLDTVSGMPLLSPHGHVDAGMLLADEPFRDPLDLLVTPDHYVTRLLHASGVDLRRLGVGTELDEAAARAGWREVCARWQVFAGTPVALWLTAELVELFGVQTRPSAETADAIWETVAAQLATDEFRPRALLARFGVEVLATTDDPASDLAAHRALAADPGVGTRVLPTFRPDRYLDPGRPGWADDVDRLGEAAGVDTGHYAGFVEALERRRGAFAAAGATAADHGPRDAGTASLTLEQATRVFRDARAGRHTTSDAVALSRHLLCEMGRMSSEDGLTMAVHPGVLRNHHRPTSAALGVDTGHDIPVRVEYTEALRPLLERYGTSPRLRLVLFTVDESAWSRELAPLAGFYPAVHLGAPWWYLDAPDAIRRARAAVTETAGISRLAGFVDDTRALCSIPARHDMARRLDAGWLAGLVAEHRLEEDEAFAAMTALVDEQPRRVWGL